METPTTSPASPMAATVARKLAFGVSVDQQTNAVLLTWVDHMGRTFPVKDRREHPSRGAAIVCATKALADAGWMPGESVAVKKMDRGPLTTAKPRSHTSKRAGRSR